MSSRKVFILYTIFRMQLKRASLFRKLNVIERLHL